MSDISANVIVSNPSQLFTMARSFKANANGKIYIGKIDTDPVNPANRIQVYLENEDGSHVPVAQPLIINSGGYPVYNGQIAKFVTEEGHSMAIYDAFGVQQFYYSNLMTWIGDANLRSDLSNPNGINLIGMYEIINDLRSITSPVNGYLYRVRRYNAGGDVINSEYKWDPTDLTTPDDGCLTIVTTAGQRLKLIHSGVTSAEQWGMIGNDNTIDNALRMSAACSSGIEVHFGPKAYRTSKYVNVGTRAIGCGKTKTSFELFYNDTPVMAQFLTNSFTNGIHLHSNESSLEFSRCTFETANNAEVHGCKISGFRHAVSLPNAWGMYLKNCSNIRIINCEFDNNSQSDVAILEGTYGAQIEGVFGTTTLHINFEPNNAQTPIRNVYIKSNKIDQLDLQENDYTGVSAEGVVIEANVVTLKYDGLPAQFIGNSAIGNIVSGTDTTPKTFGAPFDFGGAVILGKEMLVDPYLGYVSPSDANSSWSLGFSSLSAALATDRVDTDFGRALRINPTGVSGHANIQLRTPVPVTPDSSYLISVRTSVIQRTPVNQVGQHVRVIFYDASDAVLQTVIIGVNRRSSAAGTQPPVIYAGVVTAPANAAKAALVLANGSTASVANTVDFFSASFRYIQGSNRNSGQDYRLMHQQTVRPVYGTAPLTGANTPTAFVGDELKNSVPAASQPLGWVCVTSGRPGVWKSTGNIAA